MPQVVHSIQRIPKELVEKYKSSLRLPFMKLRERREPSLRG